MLFKRGFDPCLKNRGQSQFLLCFSHSSLSYLLKCRAIMLRSLVWCMNRCQDNMGIIEKVYFYIKLLIMYTQQQIQKETHTI